LLEKPPKAAFLLAINNTLKQQENLLYIGQGRALKVRHLLIIYRVYTIKQYTIGKPSLLKLQYLLLLRPNNTYNVILIILDKAIPIALLF
jgi:hypothetical protein